MKKIRIKIPGFLKGMFIVFSNLFKKNVTVNYPFEKETLAPRERGVIALAQEACTSCM